MADDFNKIDHAKYMHEAIREATEAGLRGDRPIGAVIVHKGIIISRGSSHLNTLESDVHHAENTAVLQAAAFLKKLGRECVLYTTVEPCVMCLSTIILANIRSIVFGVKDNYMATREMIEKIPYLKERVHNYKGGVLEAECIKALKSYGNEEDMEIISKGHR